MVVSLLIYSSEVWGPKKKISIRIQSAEMTFLGGNKECTKLDHIRAKISEMHC